MMFRAHSPLFRRGRVLVACLALAIMGKARAQDLGDVSVDGTLPEDSLPTLRWLLRTAEKQSPTTILQNLYVVQAKINIQQTDSALYPHLSGGASYGKSREEVSETGYVSQPSSSTNLSYSLSLNQNVFSWGQYVNQSRISRIQEAVAERRYADAYAQLLDQIRDGFLGLIASKANLKVVALNYKVNADALAIAQMQEKNGNMPPAAMGAPMLNEANARLSLDETQEAYEHSRRTLALLAGVRDIDDAGIPDEMPAAQYSETKAKAVLASILRSQGRSFFQEQIYEMQIKADKLQYKIAATGLLPKFSFGASDSLSNNTTVSFSGFGSNGLPLSTASQIGVSSLNYGLNMSWQIFDGLSTHAQKRQALAARRLDEANLQQLVDRQVEEAQDLERQINFAARAMELANTQANYAASSAQQVAANVKYGTTPESSLDSANSILYGAQYTLAIDRSIYFSRWCRLVYLAGLDPAMSYLPIHYVRGR